MIRLVLTLVLAAATVAAQTQSTPSTTPPSQPAPRSSQGPQTLPTLQQKPVDNSASVPAGSPVLTIHGLCSDGQKSADSSSCTTVVTKEQFDKLIDAINTSNQPIPPNMRRNLADAYVQLLAYSEAAEKAGVPNDPKFQEVMKLMRLRTLADMYRRDFEEKNKNAPQQEIQAYYDQNATKYQEVKLGRIFIPKNNPTPAATDKPSDKAEFEKKAEQEANVIHERVAKGENLEALQKEAYTTLGLTSPPPSVEAGTRRKGMMQAAEEQEIFALKPGEVSKVEGEPSGYIIYKLESKQSLPLDQVKDEISRELFRQKMEAQMKNVTGSVHADFNDQYFGPATPAPAPGAGAAPPVTPPSAKPATPAASSAPPKKTPPK